MKITAALAMSLALAISAQAAGKIRLCVNSSSYASIIVLIRAETIASRMFAAVGVSLDWQPIGSAACRNADQVRTVVLDFANNTPPSERPGALAYARLYEGTHIVVLFDRIVTISHGTSQMSAILGHVMAHEITHLLEGAARHSETGVMKAHWDARDFAEMAYAPLPFAREDVDLIQRVLRLHMTGD